MRLYNKINIVTLFQLAICLLNFSYAQNFERFSNKEGFNQNTINAIEQDRYGFLWYGTPNGLIRYDGYEFITYTTQSNTDGNLCSNYIYSLFNDDQGVLWIGTNLGVNVYIPWLEKFYAVPLPMKFLITHIGVGPLGRVWFSGGNELYFCELVDIEKGTFNVSDNILKAYPEPPTINSFVFIDKNTLILGTAWGLKQLSLKRDKASYALSRFDEFIHHQINSLAIIENIIWIGTSQGLYKGTFNENGLHIVAFNNTKNQPAPISVNTIFEDHSGMVWIGTKDNGLFRYNPEQDTFDHYTHSKKNELGLSSHHINALYQDDFNVLWIGTAQGGINKLDLTKKPFINYTSNPYDPYSIPDNLITSILEDSRGILWLSGYNSPLFRSTSIVKDETIDKLKFEDLQSQVPLSKGDVVRCIYEDDNGYIWLGSNAAVVVYNPSDRRFKKLDFNYENDRFNINQIRKISQIDKNHMVLAGHQIVVIANPWREIKKSNDPHLRIESILDLKNEFVQTILKDSENTWWFGTSKGLLHGIFNHNEIIIDREYDTNSEPESNRLSYNQIFSLHKEKNRLWIGTFGGGLNRMTLNDVGLPTKMTYFRKNDILPDDAIYGILQEDSGALWFSTDMGLVKFNTDRDEINVYDVRDGLPQNNFRQGCYFKGKSGYFYFGGLNGLTVFKPAFITLNRQEPEILITSLLIDNKPVKINEKINSKVVLEKSIAETGKLTIRESQRIIAFNLAVRHTSVPSKNKLAYKLEGFNDDWTENTAGKAMVTYTNLSAGNYVFKIKAANNDGIWSTKEKQLEIEVLPPWYKTWWSYLLFLIMTLSISIGIMIYFVQHERLKQGLKYEKMDKERMETINQGKLQYFTNLSHEFKTPLTLIAGPLERIIANNSDSNNTKYLTIIEKNTKRLLSLADQLIKFRRAEQGRVNLNLVKCKLGDFIYPTIEAFKDYALEKNINFFYQITEPNEVIVLDIEKIERIIFNLLSNSFKNTPPQGNISIEAGITTASGEKVINIDVVDTGKGIPPADLDNIFEYFYQLDAKTDASGGGGGIGLSFSKSLVNLLGGKISAKSNPGIETRFSVKIPSKPIDSAKLDGTTSSEKSYIKDWLSLSNTVREADINASHTDDQKDYTVLVVENEEDVQHFLTAELSVRYNVMSANNGYEALEKIKLKEPDLIVSDVMMPGMDGYELCEKIKSDLETCHIPVLLLTALGDNDHIIKGLEFGADDYISKPFSLKHLELRIDKLIQTSVQIKNYFAKHSLLPKKDNNELELSKKDKEFIENIIAVIEKNLSDSTFGVEELSTQVGLSTSHFYRRLKQLTGQVPNVYIRNLRLQRAAELLKSNEGYNVTEVMYQIGIESNSYFSTSFKKLYGVSPSEFLKRSG